MQKRRVHSNTAKPASREALLVSFILRISLEEPSGATSIKTPSSTSEARAALADGDDELLVRDYAVLKSQWPENWPRGRPGSAPLLLTSGLGLVARDGISSPFRQADHTAPGCPAKHQRETPTRNTVSGDRPCFVVRSVKTSTHPTRAFGLWFPSSPLLLRTSPTAAAVPHASHSSAKRPEKRRPHACNCHIRLGLLSRSPPLYLNLPVGAKIRNRNAASDHLAPQGVVGDAQPRLRCGLSPTGDLALAWFGFVLGSYTGSNAPNLVAAPRAPK